MADVPQQTHYARWNLILANGDKDADTTFVMTGNTFAIGRDEGNDLQLDDIHISKHHARLIRQGERLLLEDLGSVNGTRVNDTPLTAPTLLRAGDRIGLGAFTFRLEGPSLPPPSAKNEPAGWPLLLTTAVLILVFAGLMAALWLLWPGAAPHEEAAATRPAENAALLLEGPTLIIQRAPAHNSQIMRGRPMTVQVAAEDAGGVTRLELWADEHKVDEAVARSTTPLTATLRWTPNRAGTYALEVRAYNRAGQVRTALVGVLTVVAEPATPKPTPSPTSTPISTATLPPPTLTATPTPRIPLAEVKPLSTVTPGVAVASAVIVTLSPSPTATPETGGYTVPAYRALLVAGNRSKTNQPALLTLSGGIFAGGKEFILDANTETPIELGAGSYRAIWSAPSGFSAGQELTVSAGQLLFAWIVPEDRQVFLQLPGQPVRQISN